ncbi:hypothetical protein DIR46_07340 [Massilia oculi]|uniref:Uncharacterized protein n=2 Tax=Massilia oculi TaxID=945844 RepID=A0A2S2DFX6_9BURK|nr:hypothetical protein DIR46_07340 [Massilia oculi]
MMPSLQEASLAMKAEIADLRAALASRPAEVDDEGLPAPAAWAVGEELFTCHDAIPFRLLPPIGQPEPLFTAEQYRQGQRDAVAADRARRGAVEKPQVVQDWRALGYVVGATVRQEIGLGRYDDAVITHAERNGALDVEMNGRAYGWSAQFCKVVAAPTEKKAAS